MSSYTPKSILRSGTPQPRDPFQLRNSVCIWTIPKVHTYEVYQTMRSVTPYSCVWSTYDYGNSDRRWAVDLAMFRFHQQ